MLFFLSLPPEIRMSVYDILLKSSVTSKTRILYVSNNTLHYKRLRGFVCYKRGCEIHENHIPFSGDKTIWIEEVIKAERNIHRAHVDDILCLASTCRLLRSELLAFAWSNADISVNSPNLSMDGAYIFFDRLSSNTSTFIRTLQIRIEQHAWKPRELRRTVSFLRSRLPQLKQLILNIVVRSPATKVHLRDRNYALMALQSVPRETTVEFRHYCVPNRRMQYVHKGAQPAMDEETNGYFETGRAGLDPIRQKRSDERAKRKQEDQVADILEATVELRSLSIL
jgi:hypothetical protein